MLTGALFATFLNLSHISLQPPLSLTHMSHLSLRELSKRSGLPSGPQVPMPKAVDVTYQHVLLQMKEPRTLFPSCPQAAALELGTLVIIASGSGLNARSHKQERSLICYCCEHVSAVSHGLFRHRANTWGKYQCCSLLWYWKKGLWTFAVQAVTGQITCKHLNNLLPSQFLYSSSPL